MKTENPIIVLLHGLGRDKDVMQPTEAALTDAGFEVYNLSYPSTEHPIKELATKVSDQVKQKYPDRSLYFVTHSLGCIILRYIHQHQLLTHIQRAVMLAPPNRGTPIIDLMRRFSWFRKQWGPAALELATDEHGIHHQLDQPVRFECGVIAGNKTVDPWFTWTVLEGTDGDDGKVNVADTHLEGMRDHIVIPVAHPHLPKDPVVIEETIHFLKHGNFSQS